MTTILGLILLFLLGVGLGSWATFDFVRSSAPAREQALRHELAGLRAAQRLSLAAWQTRASLMELADEELRSIREREGLS